MPKNATVQAENQCVSTRRIRQSPSDSRTPAAPRTPSVARGALPSGWRARRRSLRRQHIPLRRHRRMSPRTGTPSGRSRDCRVPATANWVTCGARAPAAHSSCRAGSSVSYSFERAPCSRMYSSFSRAPDNLPVLVPWALCRIRVGPLVDIVKAGHIGPPEERERRGEVTPQYLLTNYLPDNFDPSTVDEATVHALDMPGIDGGTVQNSVVPASTAHLTTAGRPGTPVADLHTCHFPTKRFPSLITACPRQIPVTLAFTSAQRVSG